MSAGDGPPVGLVLPARVDTERLADVLLMDADELTVHNATVVPLHHDGGLILECLDTGARGRQAAQTRRREAKVLVEVVAVQTHDGRFENVGRGR